MQLITIDFRILSLWEICFIVTCSLSPSQSYSTAVTSLQSRVNEQFVFSLSPLSFVTNALSLACVKGLGCFWSFSTRPRTYPLKSWLLFSCRDILVSVGRCRGLQNMLVNVVFLPHSGPIDRFSERVVLFLNRKGKGGWLAPLEREFVELWYDMDRGMIFRSKQYKFYNSVSRYKFASDHFLGREHTGRITLIQRWAISLLPALSLDNLKLQLSASQIDGSYGRIKPVFYLCLLSNLGFLQIIYDRLVSLKRGLPKQDWIFKLFSYKYIMPITKINKESDFTPWQEESVNIMRMIRSPTLKRTSRDPSKTITQFPFEHSLSRTPKKTIERSYFSLTKINFYHPPPIVTRAQTPHKHFSFKYEGPRLNFYLSMNPKQLRLSGEKRPILKTIERESLASTNTSSQPADISTYRTVQNEEKKGLRRDPSYSHMQLVGNANNIRRMKEEHKNMRKLKILYNSRALKKKI